METETRKFGELAHEANINPNVPQHVTEELYAILECMYAQNEEMVHGYCSDHDLRDRVYASYFEKVALAWREAARKEMEISDKLRKLVATLLKGETHTPDSPHSC